MINNVEQIVIQVGSTLATVAGIGWAFKFVLQRYLKSSDLRGKQVDSLITTYAVIQDRMEDWQRHHDDIKQIEKDCAILNEKCNKLEKDLSAAHEKIRHLERK